MSAFPLQSRQKLLLPGPAGILEAATTWPSASQPKAVCIICHPDPLQEGTMNNKVVTTLIRAMEHLQIATVRFNFRGVGGSSGSYGNIIGEVDDLNAVMGWVGQSLPAMPIWLAGFSFGSFITAKVASTMPSKVSRLITIAPPAHKYEFAMLAKIQCPWLVIQGDQDEVAPLADVSRWVKSMSTPPKFVIMPEVDHFFHGQLINLQQLLIAELTT